MAEIQNEMLQLGVYSLVVRGQGTDTLMGRNVKDYIKVPGLENLLNKFIIDLDNYFQYIYEDDVESFLHSIEKRCNVKISSIKDNLIENISQMKNVDSSEIMIYYLVITKTLESLRQLIYDNEMWQLVQEIYTNINNKKPTKKIIDSLRKKDASANKEFSLLYNLVFMRHLAIVYKSKKIKDILDKIIQDILKKIL